MLPWDNFKYVYLLFYNSSCTVEKHLRSALVIVEKLRPAQNLSRLQIQVMSLSKLVYNIQVSHSYIVQ